LSDDVEDAKEKIEMAIREKKICYLRPRRSNFPEIDGI